MWKYSSPIGPIYIKYLPDKRLYGTYFQNECVDICSTPEAAANNVYMHCINCDKWDDLDGEVDAPSSLSEWKKL
ncbi:MAG: hypothetical protein LIO57_01665 [Oscillospiraceae bacterium]|nr:hypothetical protein [Oscillospiraceae bacterium]